MLKQDCPHADTLSKRTRHVGSNTSQLAGCRALAELSREQPDTHLAGSHEIGDTRVGIVLRGCGAHACKQSCEQNKRAIADHKHSPLGLKHWKVSEHICFGFLPKSCPSPCRRSGCRLLPHADVSAERFIDTSPISAALALDDSRRFGGLCRMSAPPPIATQERTSIYGRRRARSRCRKPM